jgi:RNA polymerase sigma-70 factor (ECF subfamily)
LKITNKQQFEKLFRTYYQDLASYAIRMLHDSKNAEEVAQSVFVDIWGKRDNIEFNDDIKTFLLRLTHQSSLDHIKLQKVIKQEEELVQVAETEARSEALLAEEELRVKISSLLMTMPKECRNVFVMNRIQNKNYQEIANELNISIKLVENQMGTALRSLRDGLKEETQSTLNVLKTFFWFSLGLNLMNVVIE